MGFVPHFEGGCGWGNPAGEPEHIRRKVMEVADHHAFEQSISLYNMLFKAGKLCAVPDCTQQIYNGATYCYAHEKVFAGLMTLEIPVGGSIYEDHE